MQKSWYLDSGCLKRPIKQWVPKSELVNTADMPKSKGNAKIMVPRQRLLKTYDRREVYVPHLMCKTASARFYRCSNKRYRSDSEL